MILFVFIGYVAQRGYAFGIVESIALSLFIGFSCDYCVHIAQIYAHEKSHHGHKEHGDQADGKAGSHGGSHSSGHTPRAANQETILVNVIVHAAPSLYGAALTSAGACLPLVFCQIMVFSEMGELVIMCTVTSLTLAVTFLAPWLCFLSEKPFTSMVKYLLNLGADSAIESWAEPD